MARLRVDDEAEDLDARRHVIIFSENHDPSAYVRTAKDNTLLDAP